MFTLGLKQMIGIKRALNLILLSVLFMTVLQYGQERDDTDMERVNRIAAEYFNKHNLDDTQGATPSGTEAIQEKFFSGAAAGDAFGYSVSTAGDVNGDGYDDVVIGAPYNDVGGTDAGRAYIYYGGNVFNNVADVILADAAAGNFFGISVSAAGDVNGDGYGDLIVGASGYNTLTGRAYIYFGGPIMDNIADVILTGAATNYQFGRSVSTAGDVNGDGYADVIVGAWNYNGSTGRAYIYYGGGSMDNTEDVILTGAASGDNFGTSVSSAGDVNGDGYKDVIVGANGNDVGGNNAGRAYIYFGSVNMDNIADVILTGAAAGDFFGYSVCTAGDINGDGYVDVVVGAYQNDAGGNNAGRSYVYLGGASMDNAADVVFTGSAANDQFGVSVSTAGDVNGDGYADVIVGATGNDAGGSNAGRSYIYFGGLSMDNIADIIVTGAAANDNFGFPVSAAGDFNGDGYVDVIVGSAGNDAAGTDAGRAYLYTNSLTGPDIPDEFFTGAAANDWFGYSVATAGDVNGDGYPDIIVGATGYSTNTGRAYIYFGGPGMDNIADVILTGAAVNHYFGRSVATAGDVNGDGYSDVIVGAYAYNSSTGRAYIYFGGAGMDNLADLTLTGEAISNFFGISVSTAGDVNGDGYSDVIVGAYGYSSNTGRAYLYFGGSSMDNIADVILTGEGINHYLGQSVSTAGDVNGDGYDDVLVGANGYGNNTGRAYIYFGNAIMDNTADVIFAGAAANDYFGISVSAAGDVNGDGYPDVIVGAHGNSNTGRAYIYFGGASMDNISDVVLTGAGANDSFGYSVSVTGDINGDGYADVVVGSLLNDTGGNNAGRAYVYFGSISMDNIADVIITGAAANDNFGISVSTAGDVNGDGYADVIVGAYQNDAGGNNAGRAYLYLSSSPPAKPRIMNVRDVPNDQGGKVTVRWVRSGYDARGVNKITAYDVQRSFPPVSGNFAWQTIVSVNPTNEPQYSFDAQTPYDSAANTSGTFFFRITARTNNPDDYWRSNIMSGHSVDNLAPALVKNFNGSPLANNNKLTWKANTEPDLKNYHIYRAFTSTINPDTCTAVLITTDTTGLDLSVPPGDSYYFIRARDIHDNFGPLAQLNTPLGLQQITFTALIEGFYNTGSNTMVEDTVSVLLKNINSPYATIDQSKVKLNSTGNGFVKFRQAVNGTSYYLVIKHRNSIETWSKTGQQFTNSEMIYNFTTSSNQAFGDNMKLKGSKWTIFSGDVNQDGIVDLSDLIQVDNDNENFVTGYVPSDVNGDYISDLSDMIIVDNNNAAFVGKVIPSVAITAKKIRVRNQESDNDQK